MEIISAYDSHTDERRSLGAFLFTGQVAEVKQITATKDGVSLGNHSHPYDEYFLVAKGKCMLKTFSATKGKQETPLVAPLMLKIESGEEHVFVCEKGTILIGFLPEKFSPTNMVPAKNL